MLFIVGGVHSVMVIIIGNGHDFKPWMRLISHRTNTLGKGMNPIIHPPAIDE